MRMASFLLVSAIALVGLGCRPSCNSGDTNSVIGAGMKLPHNEARCLADAGWGEHVGEGLGLWVSVERQALFGIESGIVKFGYRCSTAARGTGSRVDSNQTPLGWHEIAELIGNGLPEGAIFAERKYTGRVWRRNDPNEKDLILSRVLWLRGLEPGRNAGPGVDSYARYIYIHGTPAEEKLGTPASMGCVRLSNKDVMTLFERVKVGTRVLITQW